MPTESQKARDWVAGALGFEPRITGPKPVALPLGYAPIRFGDVLGSASPQDRPADAPYNMVSGRPPTSNRTSGQRKVRLKGLPRLGLDRRIEAQDGFLASHGAHVIYVAPASRSVAQPGSAPRSGRGGRRFKSCHSDHCFPPSLIFPVPGSNHAGPALSLTLCRVRETTIMKSVAAMPRGGT